MYSYQFFEMRKTSLKRAGGIWNPELRVFLISKKIRQIGPQAIMSRSHPSVSIEPLTCNGICCFLFEKRLPLSMPVIYFSSKFFFCSAAERLGYFHKFDSRWKFWSCRQMFDHNSFLMEVAHLNGNITEYSSNSRSSISDNGGYSESLAFDFYSGSKIRFDSFVINQAPEDILLGLIGSKDQYAKLAFKKGRIGNYSRLARFYRSDWQLIVFKLLLDPIRAFVMFAGYPVNFFSLKYKIAPDCFLESIVVITRSEVFSTN